MRFEELVLFVHDHADDFPHDDPDRVLLLRFKAAVFLGAAVAGVTNEDVLDALRCADALRRLKILETPSPKAATP